MRVAAIALAFLSFVASAGEAAENPWIAPLHPVLEGGSLDDVARVIASAAWHNMRIPTGTFDDFDQMRREWLSPKAEFKKKKCELRRKLHSFDFSSAITETEKFIWQEAGEAVRTVPDRFRSELRQKVSADLAWGIYLDVPPACDCSPPAIVEVYHACAGYRAPSRSRFVND